MHHTRIYHSYIRMSVSEPLQGNNLRHTMGDISTDSSHNGKKQILLNAFDMSTVGHLSPGQWKVRFPDSTSWYFIY